MQPPTSIEVGRVEEDGTEWEVKECRPDGALGVVDVGTR
jgi:hypothetical protein